MHRQQKQKNRMIISHKQKVFQRPPPAMQFDKFLKIRSEKQSIIQSQSQPITQKVQGFQQLLRLTKTGASISTQSSHKRHLNSQLKNKSESSKTINVVGGYGSSATNTNHHHMNTETEVNRFVDDFQSDEAQLKKLNKMVFGITEWEEDREKDSFHVDRNQKKGNFYCRTSYQKRRGFDFSKKKDKALGKQENQQQNILHQRKQQAYTSCQPKKFRKFYAPLSKYQSTAQLNKITQNFTKTSSKLNYPPTLLNCNFLEENSTHFRDLKNKIKVLESKAINQYGLRFDPPHMLKTKKQYQWDDEKDSSEEKQNEELSFSDLQLGPILAKEFPNRYESYNQTVAEKENPINDASIPKNLIDIVQSKSQSFHNFGFVNNANQFGNNHLSGDLKNRKMKKGYLYRPKTFKPTYTYIKI